MFIASSVALLMSIFIKSLPSFIVTEYSKGNGTSARFF